VPLKRLFEPHQDDLDIGILAALELRDPDFPVWIIKDPSGIGWIPCYESPDGQYDTPPCDFRIVLESPDGPSWSAVQVVNLGPGVIHEPE
jgi:hypothetical protein